MAPDPPRGGVKNGRHIRFAPLGRNGHSSMRAAVLACEDETGEIFEVFFIVTAKMIKTAKMHGLRCSANGARPVKCTFRFSLSHFRARRGGPTLGLARKWSLSKPAIRSEICAQSFFCLSQEVDSDVSDEARASHECRRRPRCGGSGRAHTDP